MDYLGIFLEIVKRGLIAITLELIVYLPLLFLCKWLYRDRRY